MEQWRSHPAACQCGVCDLARMVSVSRVYCVVWGWQASIQRTPAAGPVVEGLEVVFPAVAPTHPFPHLVAEVRHQ